MRIWIDRLWDLIMTVIVLSALYLTVDRMSQCTERGGTIFKVRGAN